MIWRLLGKPFGLQSWTVRPTFAEFRYKIWNKAADGKSKPLLLFARTLSLF